MAVSHSLHFEVEATSASARAGHIRTPHGEVPTPAFMPVATQGSVKTLAPYEVEEIGTHILLANAYHLYLRPGVDLVRKMGGLHSFMRWPGPILTDSGGFQAFSLGTLKKVSDEGVLFKSHIDGSQHLFTPEAAIAHQQALGADIIMCLDQCIANSEGEEPVPPSYATDPPLGGYVPRGPRQQLPTGPVWNRPGRRIPSPAPGIGTGHHLPGVRRLRYRRSGGGGAKGDYVPGDRPGGRPSPSPETPLPHGSGLS